MTLDIEYAKSLPYEKIRGLYKSHLQSLGLGRNTVGTFAGDTFYLWNNASKEVFWDTVTAADFEDTARTALRKALSQNSTGNVDKLINGYVSNLRRFRDFMNDAELDVPEKDDETALKEFLLDIDCLAPLSEWTGKINLFDVLKISRVEIRHSNILAWLLNPNENHGLGDGVLRGFIQYVVTASSDKKDVFATLLMDCHDFSVQREWHSIDIIAISPGEQFVLCIENKIGTGEHGDQLNRYRKTVEELYPQYRKMYIYLSPEGGEASDPDNWCSMGYEDVLSIIENVSHKVKLLPEVTLLIDNYIDTIRRDIVGDEKLARICAEIYAKHQKALDLIFENKPDRASQFADILHDWANMMMEKGELIYAAEKSGKTYTRFKTKIMSDLMPDAEEAISGWGTHNYYFYEIYNNDGKEFHIQLVLNSKNIPDDLRLVCDRLSELRPPKQHKDNWQWRTLFSTRNNKVDEELSEERIFEQLSKRFAEIKAFEADLLRDI